MRSTLRSESSPDLRWFLPGLTVLALLLPACDEASTTGAADLDALPRLRVQPNGVRIGDMDDPNVGFTQVRGIDVDRDGHTFVVEGTVREIRVYGRDGVFMGRMGRGGGGPGEFETVPRFGVMGDTVWAIDNRVDRITLFDRAGAVLSTGTAERVSVPLPNGYGHALPWIMRPDGTFSSNLGRLAYRSESEPTGVAVTDSIPVPLVRFDPSGSVIDTVGWAGKPPPRLWRPPSEEPELRGMLRVQGRPVAVPTASATLPWWLPLADGYVVVETPLAERPDDGVVQVTRFGLSGDTVYHRTLRYRPEAYSAADLDTIAARAARGEPGGMVPFMIVNGRPAPPPDNWEAIARTIRGAMDFPDFKPPLENVWLAQDESVWLRRTGSDPSIARWVILEPDGATRGQLDLPADVEVHWSRGDSIWAVVPDELEVPWVTSFRMEPA